MALAMSSKTSNSYIPHNGSNRSKVKTKIVKTYHHNICVTPDGLSLRGDTTLEDSDPEETQHLLSTLRLSSARSCVDSVDSKSSDRVARTKYSIGGISAVDSGVVSHDSLLDRYRDMSTTSQSERSESPSSRYSTTTRGSYSSPARGEFDPLNKSLLLDCRLRSRSRNRVEEQRAKSPCRSHGVKQMINFFEGSQETLTSFPERTSTDTPRIKQPLHTSLNPLRVSRGRRTSKATASSPTTAPPEKGEERGVPTSTRTKQESSLRLTCAAGGYSNYSPTSDRKTCNGGGGEHTSPNGAEGCSTGLINGATNSLDNGVDHTPPADHTDDSLVVNGLATSDVNKEDTTPQINNNAAITVYKVNGHLEKSAPLVDNSSNHVADCKDINVVVTDSMNAGGSATPLTNGTDEVDRANLELNLNVKPVEPELKIPNGLSSAVDSPSKKNGDWFLKVTDNAEKKLLSLCESSQRDLDEPDIPEEACGQIRAAIGKAHLLVNKKFKQFRGLCEKNLTQGADEPFPTTSQDLAGFWDMVYIQIENCETSFEDIARLKANAWVQESKPEPVEHSKKAVTPRGHKSIVSSNTDTKVKCKPASTKPSSAVKARDEARKRLMAAKRAMKERRNSETDDVIFVSSS